MKHNTVQNTINEEKDIVTDLNNRHNNKLSILSVALTDSNFKRQELINELDDKKRELKILRGNNAKQLDEWIDEENKLSARLDNKEKDIEKTKDEFREVEIDIKQTTSELITQRTELELMMDERDFMNCNYQERRSDLENEISNYKTALTSLTEQINTNMAKVIKKESENLYGSERVSKMKTKVKSNLDGQSTELNNLKDRLEELREIYDKEESHAMNLLETRVQMKALLESSKELNYMNVKMVSDPILPENNELKLEKVDVCQIKTTLLKSQKEKEKVVESFMKESDERTDRFFRNNMRSQEEISPRSYLKPTFVSSTIEKPVEILTKTSHIYDYAREYDNTEALAFINPTRTEAPETKERAVRISSTYDYPRVERTHDHNPKSKNQIYLSQKEESNILHNNNNDMRELKD